MSACIQCSFDLPSDWPKVKVTEQISGITRETNVCVPCQRRLAGIVERPDQVMTPTRTEATS